MIVYGVAFTILVVFSLLFLQVYYIYKSRQELNNLFNIYPDDLHTYYNELNKIYYKLDSALSLHWIIIYMFFSLIIGLLFRANFD